MHDGTLTILVHGKTKNIGGCYLWDVDFVWFVCVYLGNEGKPTNASKLSFVHAS